MKVLMFQHLPAPYLVDFLNLIGQKIKLTVIFKEARNQEREDHWLKNNYDFFRAFFLNQSFFAKLGLILKLAFSDYDLFWNCDYSNLWCMMITIIAKLRGKTVLMHADGGIPIPRKIDFIIKKVMNMADYFASSGAMCDRYYDYYDVPQSKRLYYRFTSQMEEDLKNNQLLRSQKDRLREKHNLAKEQIVLFSVGQQIPRKGYDVLAKAMIELPREITLLIAGGMPEERVKKIIEENQLNNIHFLGFKDKNELAEYYALSDIFVLPTRYDIWGLVINEAMSFGLPLISTLKCAAAVQYIEEFENGLLVEIEDEKQLAEAICKLVENKEKRDEMGQASLKAIQDVSIERMTEDYLHIFDFLKEECGL